MYNWSWTLDAQSTLISSLHHSVCMAALPLILFKLWETKCLPLTSLSPNLCFHVVSLQRCVCYLIWKQLPKSTSFFYYHLLYIFSDVQWCSLNFNLFSPLFLLNIFIIVSHKYKTCFIIKRIMIYVYISLLDPIE